MDKPTEQKKVAEEKPPEVVPASKKPAEPKEVIPEGSSDRTKEQFDKLKKKNKELSDKLKKAGAEPVSVLDSLEPKPVPPRVQPRAGQYPYLTKQQQGEVKQGLVDKEGYVDVALLNQRLQQANAEAARAKQEVRQVRKEVRGIEESRQVREAHEKYPQLDPKSEVFNQKFYDLVRNELIGQMMKGKRDLMVAAERVSNLLQPNKDKAEKEQKAETKKEQTEQINATGKAKQGAYTSADQDRLVEGTMRGKKGALAERLNRAGIGPK